MSFFEEYCKILADEAEKHRDAAAQAKACGDERTHSMELMQASMLGPMLEQFGRVEHEKLRPGIMQQQIDAARSEQQRHEALGDFDQADRFRIKAEMIVFALEALRKLEAEQTPEAQLKPEAGEPSEEQPAQKTAQTPEAKA